MTLNINGFGDTTASVGPLGGALFVTMGAHVQLNETAFVGNAALGVGGAIALASASLSVTNSYFGQNTAASGGAIVAAELEQQEQVFGIPIQVVQLSVSPVRAERSWFVSNTAALAGGAVLLSEASIESTVHSFANSTFISNTAASGGALLCLSCRQLQLSAVLFETNAASGLPDASEGVGGGLVADGTTASVLLGPLSSSFNGNSASAGGGAIALAGGCFMSSAPTTKTVFTNNAALDGMGGAFIAQQSEIDFRGDFVCSFNRAGLLGACGLLSAATLSVAGRFDAEFNLQVERDAPAGGYASLVQPFAVDPASRGGGGIAAVSSSLNLTFLVTRENSASKGGAILCLQCVLLQISEAYFFQDSATDLGGVLALVDTAGLVDISDFHMVGKVRAWHQQSQTGRSYLSQDPPSIVQGGPRDAPTALRVSDSEKLWRNDVYPRTSEEWESALVDLQSGVEQFGGAIAIVGGAGGSHIIFRGRPVDDLVFERRNLNDPSRSSGRTAALTSSSISSFQVTGPSSLESGFGGCIAVVNAPRVTLDHVMINSCQAVSGAVLAVIDSKVSVIAGMMTRGIASLSLPSTASVFGGGIVVVLGGNSEFNATGLSMHASRAALGGSLACYGGAHVHMSQSTIAMPFWERYRGRVCSHRRFPDRKVPCTIVNRNQYDIDQLFPPAAGLTASADSDRDIFRGVVAGGFLLVGLPWSPSLSQLAAELPSSSCTMTLTDSDMHDRFMDNGVGLVMVGNQSSLTMDAVQYTSSSTPVGSLAMVRGGTIHANNIFANDVVAYDRQLYTGGFHGEMGASLNLNNVVYTPFPFNFEEGKNPVQERHGGVFDHTRAGGGTLFTTSPRVFELPGQYFYDEYEEILNAPINHVRATNLFIESVSTYSAGAAAFIEGRSVVVVENMTAHTMVSDGAAAVFMIGGDPVDFSGESDFPPLHVSMKNVEIINTTGEANSGGAIAIYHPSANVSIENMLLRGCTLYGTGGGGCIAVADRAQLALQNVSIVEPWVFGFGGAALVIESGGVVSATGLSVVDARAFDSGVGGAVIVSDPQSRFECTNCSFVGAEATGSHGGAMLVNNGAKAVIKRSTFHNLRAGRNGGAIMATDTGSELSLARVTFSSVSSAGVGGAIAAAGGAIVAASDSTFSAASALNAGGAINVQNSQGRLTNCTFNESLTSSATGVGGAIACSNCQLQLSSMRLFHSRASIGGDFHVTGTQALVNGSSFASVGAQAAAGASFATRNSATVALCNTSFRDSRSNTGGAFSVLQASTVALSCVNSFAGCSATNDGAAFSVSGTDSSVRVSGDVRIEHSSARFGAAVSIASRASFAMSKARVTIDDAVALGGGGAFDMQAQAKLTVSASQIFVLRAQSFGSGGAFRISSGSVVSLDQHSALSVFDSAAETFGGGMHLSGASTQFVSPFSPGSVSRVVFSNCSAGTAGAGLAVSEAAAAHLYSSALRIAGCRLSSVAGQGAGLFMTNAATAIFNDFDVVGNTAVGLSSSGAGIHVDASQLNVIGHATIVDNSGRTQDTVCGAGLFATDSTVAVRSVNMTANSCRSGFGGGVALAGATLEVGDGTHAVSHFIQNIAERGGTFWLDAASSIRLSSPIEAEFGASRGSLLACAGSSAAIFSAAFSGLASGTAASTASALDIVDCTVSFIGNVSLKSKVSSLLRALQMLRSTAEVKSGGRVSILGFGSEDLSKGGGMHLADHSVFWVARNSTLSLLQNTAIRGGGAYIGSDSVFASGPGIASSNIAGAQVGLLACNHSSLSGAVPDETIVSIRNNNAVTGAGMLADSGSSICLSAAIIEQNSATDSAGALELESVDPSSFLHHVSVRNNLAGCSRAGLVCRAGLSSRCAVQPLWVYSSLIDMNNAPQTVRRDLSCGSADGAQTQCEVVEVLPHSSLPAASFTNCQASQSGVARLGSGLLPLCTSFDKRERSWYITPKGSNVTCCGAQGTPCGSITSAFRSTSLQTGDALIYGQGTHTVLDQPISVSGGSRLEVQGASIIASQTATLFSNSPGSLLEVSSLESPTVSSLLISNISIQVSDRQSSPVIACFGTEAVPAELLMANVVLFRAATGGRVRAGAVLGSNCRLDLHNVTIVGFDEAAIQLVGAGSSMTAHDLNVTSGTSEGGGSALRLRRQASAALTNASFFDLAVFSGQNGGAIHCSEGARFACDGCRFAQNGRGASAGGDIYASQCSVLLHNSSSIASQAVRGAHAFLGLGAQYAASQLSVLAAVAGLGESGTGGAFHVEEKSSLELSHFTAAGCQSGDRGGVVYAVNSQITLSNATLSNSNATNDGGCLAVLAGATLHMSQSSLHNCVAQSLGQGGGLFLQQESSASLRNISMSHCAAVRGGCISATSSTLSISSSNLENSTASFDGGCILFEAGAEMVLQHQFNGGDLFLRNCSAQSGAGGGAALAGLGDGGLSVPLSVELDGLNAVGCRAEGGVGGGLSAIGNVLVKLTALEQSSTLTACKAESGGALAGGAGVLLDVSGVQFGANIATERGGALFTESLALVVQNSTFVNNRVSFAGAPDFPELHAAGASSIFAKHSTETAVFLTRSIFYESQVAVVFDSIASASCVSQLECTRAFVGALQQDSCPLSALQARRCSLLEHAVLAQDIEPGTLYIANSSMGSAATPGAAEGLAAFIVWSGTEPSGIATNTFCEGTCLQQLGQQVSILAAVKFLASRLGSGSDDNSCSGVRSDTCALGDFLPAVSGTLGTPFTHRATLHESAALSGSVASPGSALPGFYVWPVDVYGATVGSHLPPNHHFAQLGVQAQGVENNDGSSHFEDGISDFSSELAASTMLANFAELPQAVQAAMAASAEQPAHRLWPSYMAWTFLNSTALVPETPDSIWRLQVAGEVLALPPARFSSCPPGQAPTNTLPGQAFDGAQCQACPIGTFSAAGKRCVLCPAGRFTSQTGAAVCAACSPGTHQPTQGTPCVPCADGSYTAQAGQTSCLQCPRVGVSCISGTIELLSGFYFVGVIPSDLQVNSSTDTPLNFPSTQAATRQRVVLDLNTSLVTRDTQVFGCLSQYGCVASDEKIECAEGHEGIACGSCRAGYVPSGSACQKCFPAAVSWLMLLGLLAISVGIVAAAAVRQTFSDTAPFKIAIRMGLNHIQILTLTGMLRARGTLLFRQWFALLESVTGLGIASPFAALRCLFQASAYTEFTAAVTFPLLLCLVAAAAGSIASCLSAPANRRWQAPCKYLVQGHFGSTWVFIGFICYAVVTMAVLNAVRCTDAPILGSRWLINDMQVQCFRGAHIGVVVVACIVGICFCLGFPLLTALILNRNKEELKQKQSALTRRFGFLVSGLKIQRAYYESVVMLRKMLLSCVILVVNPVYQSVIGMLLMFGSLNVQLLWSPYSRPVFNHLEAASLWCIIITLMLSLSYLEEEQSEAELQADPDYVSASERWSTGLLLTVNLAYVLVLLATIARLFLQQRAAQDKQDAKQRRKSRMTTAAGNGRSPVAASSPSSVLLLPVRPASKNAARGHQKPSSRK